MSAYRMPLQHHLHAAGHDPSSTVQYNSPACGSASASVLYVKPIVRKHILLVQSAAAARQAGRGAGGAGAEAGGRALVVALAVACRRADLRLLQCARPGRVRSNFQ